MISPTRLITLPKASLHTTTLALWRSPLKYSRKKRRDAAPEWWPVATTGGKLGGQEAADTRVPNSIFYDPVAQKLVNHMMKGGNKAVSQNILDDTFERLKIQQLAKRHAAVAAGSSEHVEINPLTLLHKAVTNATPTMGVVIKKSGMRKTITPVPLLESRRLGYGCKFLVHAAREKMGDYSKHNNDIPMSKRLAEVIMESCDNKGSAVNKKTTLHRKAQANRGAALNRWWWASSVFVLKLFIALLLWILI